MDEEYIEVTVTFIRGQVFVYRVIYIETDGKRSFTLTLKNNTQLFMFYRHIHKLEFQRNSYVMNKIRNPIWMSKERF